MEKQLVFQVRLLSHLEYHRESIGDTNLSTSHLTRDPFGRTGNNADGLCVKKGVYASQTLDI